jgi:protein SERAC1
MRNRWKHYPPCVNCTGLTVLYQPTDDPTFDIIFVHGLQGHPRRTWTKKIDTNNQYRPHAQSTRITEVDDRSIDSCCSDKDIFWPGHLPPRDLPDCHILALGYDAVVTRGWFATNRNSLFTHAKDFFFTLERVHPRGRPIVFVAHSLGGITVKEILRRSEVSRELLLRDIVNSTVGIIFLGTPHRGSPGLATLAETVRRASCYANHTVAKGRILADSNVTIKARVS